MLFLLIKEDVTFSSVLEIRYFIYGDILRSLRFRLDIHKAFFHVQSSPTDACIYLNKFVVNQECRQDTVDDASGFWGFL